MTGQGLQTSDADIVETIYIIAILVIIGFRPPLRESGLTQLFFGWEGGFEAGWDKASPPELPTGIPAGAPV